MPPVTGWTNGADGPPSGGGGGGPPTGAAGGQLGSTYPNPDVRGIRSTLGPALLTVGSIADGETLRRVGSDLVGYRPPVLVGSFGGKSDGLGRFVLALGKSSDGDDTSKAKTRHAAPFSGTIVRVGYQTKEGSTDVGMKIHVAGLVPAGADFTLASINADFGGVEVVSVSVSAGDSLEIEYDDDNSTGDKPGESTWQIYLEAS